jgi:hypothetical protein
MAKLAEYGHGNTSIGELEDEIKHLKQRLEDVRKDLDDERDLVRRLRESTEGCDAIIESWCEAFDMEMTDDGWTWKPFLDQHNRLCDDYNELVKKWNRYVPFINSTTRRDVGRPLEASSAQVMDVIALRVDGKSLSEIVEATS